jgi:hypothetical protein
LATKKNPPRSVFTRPVPERKTPGFRIPPDLFERNRGALWNQLEPGKNKGEEVLLDALQVLELLPEVSLSGRVVVVFLELELGLLRVLVLRVLLGFLRDRVQAFGSLILGRTLFFGQLKRMFDKNGQITFRM